MNRIGLLLALLGVAGAAVLLAQQDLTEVRALLATAGFGLVVAGATHALPMAVNAEAWRVLLPGAKRPSLAAMTLNVWVRESINGLLPVARIGGEVASYRLLRGEGVGAAPAAASLMVDMAIGILSQMAFALVGLALLATQGAGIGWQGIAGSALLGLALAGGFILAQRANLLSRMAGALNAMAADRFSGFLAHSARIDRMARRLWRARGAIAACFLWQLLGWALGALEIWLALYFLGHPVSPATALAIESLIQALSSAAFVVPGALGLQEAGFLGLGLLVGLPAEAGAALAIARRIRDLVVFIPGLLAWVWAEKRILA